MKIVVSLILILSLLSGCTISNAQLKTAQPQDVRYWKPDQQLFEMKAEEIIFRAPKKVTQNKDGSVTTEPIMITKKTYNKDGSLLSETHEPVMAEFHAKDTSAKPPLTILDIIKSGLGYGVIYGLGYQGLAVIKAMSEGLSKSPLVVEKQTENTNLVGINKDNEPFIDRG